MDKLSELGTVIAEVLEPTYELYKPLLLKQADQIKSTRRESFTYGSHPCQRLDLYTPTQGVVAADDVFIFIYGGGFVRGAKINPNFPLVYANVGHFFAESLGCRVVIPDYRLMGDGAVFPSGGEDLELVVNWVKEKIDHRNAKSGNLFLMGNSAGGVNLATYLLAPQFAPSRQAIIGSDVAGWKLRAAVFVGVPFHFDHAKGYRLDTLSRLYSDVRQQCPLGLFRAWKADASINEVKAIAVLVMSASLDPKDEILIPNEDFVKEWRNTDSVSDNLIEVVIDGHNHISPVLGLGTGIEAEEHWGRQVVEFVKGVSSTL